MGTERLNRSNSSPKKRLKNGSFWKGETSDRLLMASTSMFTTAGETFLTILTTGLSAFFEGIGAADEDEAQAKTHNAAKNNANGLKDDFVTRMKHTSKSKIVLYL
jgi:hypothetical protein